MAFSRKGPAMNKPFHDVRLVILLSLSLPLLVSGCTIRTVQSPVHDPNAYERGVPAQKKGPARRIPDGSPLASVAVESHAHGDQRGVAASKRMMGPQHTLSVPMIPSQFVEPYGNTGRRFSIRQVSIEGQGNVIERRRGGTVDVSFDLLHDCPLCGNAINQVIVGLAGEEQAQVSVWNGKQRSGGGVRVVNPGSRGALAEDNPNAAQWVRVRFQLIIPDRPGTHYVRARYAQDYQGNLMTEEGARIAQPVFANPLKWWKVDRPQGPEESANIGAVVVRAR